MVWSEGLTQLQTLANTSAVEHFGLFIATKSHSGSWYFPGAESKSDQSLNISKDKVLELFLAYANERDLAEDEVITLVIAHTHPHSTILRLIEEDDEEFVNNHSLADVYDPTGRVTLPPSRSDLAALYELDRMIQRTEYSHINVAGLIVGPIGFYTHRLFDSRRELVQMFPEFAEQTPYSHLDIVDQVARDQEMDQLLFDSTRDWLFRVNQSSETFAPNSDEEFYSLQRAYAGYGIGALLKFTPSPGDETPNPEQILFDWADGWHGS